ncbi:MAG TPA: hypothetical protein PLM16_01500 [Candidatus Woesebacteria bacterium]|nr:hypothetical protein [Candidatus Woesebacteria bacterium]
MIKILDLLTGKKDKFISSKTFVLKHEKEVYLLVVNELTGKIVRSAVSQDGFIFETCKVKHKEVRDYPFYQRKLRDFLQGRYHQQIAPGSEFIDTAKITIQNAFSTHGGVLVFFHYHHQQSYTVGAVGFTKGDNPQVIWRHSEPVWQMGDVCVGRKIEFLNLIKIKRQFVAYWVVEGEGVWATTYPNYRITEQISLRKNLQFSRPEQNPILAPNQRHSWESFTTFNPAALYDAGKVHLFYRAQGYDYVSSVGYATSSNGLTIDQRFDKPIFKPTQPFESTVAPGQLNMDFVSAGCGGCEDPRVTKIDDRIYMTYVAFNGYSEPRIALTSIALNDFLNHNWLWTHPILISPPGVVDKSACILPEKINGKYVVFHRIFPNILIDFVDDLNFSRGQYLKGQYKISPRSALWWDSRKIGAGAPPLKTKDGWLLIYQAIDDKEGYRYKVGAMLLDLNDPTKVLYRTRQPIIEPDEWYENDGFKAGVVYPCGAVIMNDQIFVYYGGADSYVCVATANLDQFLDQLKTTGIPEINPASIQLRRDSSLKKKKRIKLINKGRQHASSAS